MSEELIIRFFDTYAGYLTELGGVYTNNIITEVLRRLAWSLILGMRKVCNSVEEIYSDVFDIISIVKSEDILSFADSLKVYVTALLAMALVIVGYKVIAVEDYDLKRTVRNVITATVILAGAFSVISALSDITLLSVKSLGETHAVTTADGIITDSVIDYVYRYENGTLIPSADLSSSEAAAFIWQGNRIISSDELRILDINEKVSDVLGENTEPFDHTCYTDRNGELAVKKFSDRSLAENGLNWILELMAGVPSYRLSYARYYVEFGTLILSILALTVAYFFSVFKVFTIVFELIVTQTVLKFAAVTDLSSGERTKKMLLNIAGAFLSIFAMAVLYRLYGAILTVTLKMPSVSEHRILRTIAVLAYTFAIIDGPNVIKDLLGIDIGLSSAAGTFFAVWHAARSAVTAVKGTAGMFSHLSSSTVDKDKGSDRGPSESGSYAEFMDMNSSSDLSSLSYGGDNDDTSGRDPENTEGDEADNLSYASSSTGSYPYDDGGFTDTQPPYEDSALPDDGYVLYGSAAPDGDLSFGGYAEAFDQTVTEDISAGSNDEEMNLASVKNAEADDHRKENERRKTNERSEVKRTEEKGHGKTGDR